MENILHAFLRKIKSLYARRKACLLRQKKRKRMVARYRHILRSRKKEDFHAAWNRTRIEYDENVLKQIADIMEWPTSLFFPDDRLKIVFMNVSSDLRDVEAMLLAEELTGISFDVNNLPLHMIDIFSQKDSGIKIPSSHPDTSQNK